MSASAAAKRRRWPVVGPPFVWLALFFLAPFAMVLRISLSEPATAQPPYRPHLPWSLDPEAWRPVLDALGLENYRTLIGDDLYIDAALSSLGLAASSTLVLLLVGYPIALAMARASAGWRPILVAIVIVPFWTSLLIRVYAWMAILSPEGFLNRFLLAIGAVDEPLQILNTYAAVMVGVVYSYLPFMILPLYASLERQDPTLIEAASDLGASPLKAFWTVTVPLSRPGIVAGALLCFIPIVGEFIVPDLLGGSETLMLGRTLWSEFFSNRDWPLASAVAVVMTVLLVGPIVLYRNAEARRVEAGT